MELSYVDMTHICGVCRQEHPETSCEELAGVGRCEVRRAEREAEGLCGPAPKEQ